MWGYHKESKDQRFSPIVDREQAGKIKVNLKLQNYFLARVAESGYALALGASGEELHGGSSPPSRTRNAEFKIKLAARIQLKEGSYAGVTQR